MAKKIEERLRILEAANLGDCSDVRNMTDKQLKAIVRKGIRELKAKPKLSGDEERQLEYLTLSISDDLPLETIDARLQALFASDADRKLTGGDA